MLMVDEHTDKCLLATALGNHQVIPLLRGGLCPAAKKLPRRLCWSSQLAGESHVNEDKCVWCLPTRMQNDWDESPQEVFGFCFLNRTVKQRGLLTTSGIQYVHKSHFARIWVMQPVLQKVPTAVAQIRQAAGYVVARTLLLSSSQESREWKLLL